MARHHTQVQHVGRAGWFAVGALAASVAFVLLFIAGDYFKAVSSEPDADMPAVVIEGQ
jgi:hypothetical protein